MAPIKRKGNVAEEAATQKRARFGADKKENKKQKTNDSDDTKSKSEDDSKPTDLSVLRDDEPAFPRGGSSVLTPLERKQIQIQAQKDVLFEQRGSKKSQNVEDDDDDDEGNDDVDMGDADDAAAKKPRKQRKTKAAKKKADKEASEKKGVRVEGLNFKVCLRNNARFHN